jgi:hypothetical protein
MALQNPRPLNEAHICESTTSIATTPVASALLLPLLGYVQRVMAAAGGTTTGTTAVSVQINGGSDIAGGALTIAAGTGARAGTTLSSLPERRRCYFRRLRQRGRLYPLHALRRDGCIYPRLVWLVIRLASDVMQYVGTGQTRPASERCLYGRRLGTIASAIGAGTYKVRVVVTSAAFVKIGKSVTATASDVYMPADSPEYFSIVPARSVSAIQSAAGGTLHVTEVA